MVKRFLQRVAGITVICLVAVSGVLAMVPMQKVSADYPNGDCDPNAVLRCGVNSISELKSDYSKNQGGDTKAIFAHFGMKSTTAFDGMKRGRVTKSGEIWVSNTKVATGAVTAGRTKMGNDEVKVPGANAWMRPPSRSFQSDSLEAFVKLNSNGEFVYGVILSCGNPVQAQHKIKSPPKKQPQPKPEQPKPVPVKPGLAIQKDVRVIGNSEFEQSVEADPGDELQYRITIDNLSGKADVKNLRIQDSLPQGVTFEDTALEGSESIREFQVSDLVGEGIELETLAKGTLVEITFVVKVGDAVDACETPLRNVASAEADDVPEEEDDALATVCQPETPPAPTTPEQPEEQQPQVLGEQTPTILTAAGPTGILGAFSATSIIGFAAYKLKDFYLLILK
jgi:uncharacterized repeat protein (TIGR01451 family)